MRLRAALAFPFGVLSCLCEFMGEWLTEKLWDIHCWIEGEE